MENKNKRVINTLTRQLTQVKNIYTLGNLYILEGREFNLSWSQNNLSTM